MWFSKKKEAQPPDATEAKLLNAEKRDMIAGVEELSQTLVKEVMVPRIDIDFIPNNITTTDLLQKIKESGHSRFPVFSGSIDNVTGVLYVKDLIYALGDNTMADISKGVTLDKIIRTPYFVPETKRIDSLLREFKRKHLHIALAIDEYGGIAGLVTMEDIIEEIVGDIQDEFDNEHEDIINISTGVNICDATMDLDDLNEVLGANFPAQEFDSLGGFVFDLFGKIPVRFEKVTWEDWDFIVQDMEGHRIKLIKIVRHANCEDNTQK